ncbi:MAG: thiamine-phosphate kinase [Luminiphilus sp.]|jgi:thiamine-monophosphate kinase|nr:thiamine-phosphate kinase [Luminiphilus sp.]
MAATEFQLIDHFFAGIGDSSSVLLGIGDDAAALELPAGHVLLVSTDTVSEGVHFPRGTHAVDVAYRAVIAAASDLAAMSAEPLGMLLALTLARTDSEWLAGFATGLREAAAITQLPLVGGDTTQGALTVSITVLGSAPRATYLTRQSAQPGDRLCVSGTLGDAAAGLSIRLGETVADDQSALFLTDRFTRPSARLALGQLLRGHATSAIDISDGLLADAGHLARCSGVALEVDSAALPLSEAMQTIADEAQQLNWALGGGDDYELLFTLPADATLPSGCTEIGRVRSGSGVFCDVMPEQTGYEHFVR